MAEATHWLIGDEAIPLTPTLTRESVSTAIREAVREALTAIQPHLAAAAADLAALRRRQEAAALTAEMVAVRDQVRAAGGFTGPAAERWAHLLVEHFADVVGPAYFSEPVIIDSNPEMQGLRGHAGYDPGRASFVVTIGRAKSYLDAAAILAHELGHLARGHVNKPESRALAKRDADGTLDAQAVARTINQPPSDALAAFIQETEAEANQFAADVLIAWGIAPADVIAVMDQLYLSP